MMKAEKIESLCNVAPLIVNRSFRFWLLYACAWLAYGLSLGAIFIYQGGHLTLGTLGDVVCNVLPATLLGILVVGLCERLAWHSHARARFLATQTLLSILYAVLWCALTLACLSLRLSLERGQWTFNRWGSYALQWQLFTGLMIYFTIASAFYVRQIGERLRAEERRTAQLEMRAAKALAAQSRAELSALRAQLNPHFLFNTLHSLMALVRTDATAAETALERFAHMLRYVLRAQQTEAHTATTDVTLADEWAFTQSYLELESLRLGARLRVTTRIEPDALDCALPAFTLQPLVENAVKHAIATRARGGALHISATIDDAALRLEVRDDGAGVETEQLHETSGLGLRLVRDSLMARYGEQAVFDVATAPNAGFIVRLALPCEQVSISASDAQAQTTNEKATLWSYAR